MLGGTSISRQIVYAAHELNYDVYVTDYLEESPCKKIAEKSFMVSCTDVDSVVQLIQEEQIDGVIMGYADVLMSSYVKICKKAGIPCYANLHAVEMTADKADFKKLCREFEIPVVPEYQITDVEKGDVIYPLIIKPVDNSGARGIYICHDKKEFDEYYPLAMNYSQKKHVLIERFMTGMEATIFYYLHQGEIYLLGAGDRHMLKFSDRFLQLPVGYTFPSVGQDEFLKVENENIKRLFRSLDMNEGMVFMQCFNDNGKYIIYEMGYRLTGSIEHHLMEYAYGFNHLKAILQYSVNDRVNVEALKSHNLGKAIMANVTLLLSEGVIGHYEGIDEVMRIPGVLHVHKSYSANQVIDENVMGKLAQVGIRVLLVADNKEQLLQRMDLVKATLHVISIDNEDMIIRNYTYQELCKA